MAKKTWNNPIDKTVDWGGDVSTDNLPVSGAMVQKFIKESLDGKAGVFYYDADNNRYLVFADEESKNEFIENPTNTELIIGTFDAPFNYTAEISLSSPAYNAVFLGSVGNYIDFTFDIKNKQGASTGENVTVSYTFIRNATRKTVKETRRFGDTVHFNIDKYIGEGTNTIIVGITGQTTLAATTVAITYQVVNLTISDDLDISKAYNLSTGSQILEVPFTVSGYGTKVVEWYIDGVALDFIKTEDEVVDVSTTRTKHITLSNLQQGRHSLQLRAYSIINGEKFYTDTLYRDILVYTGVNNALIIGISTTIPRDYGVLDGNTEAAIYDMVQYIPYTLRFATYSPSNISNTEVTITLGGELKGSVSSSNGVVNEFTLVSTASGTKELVLKAGDVVYTIPTVVAETSMNLREITEGLLLDFNALGKSNNSTDRGEWSYGDYIGTLNGFNWNNTSGWVNGRLEMNAGSTFGINIQPLGGNPTATGKTIEIEWSTKNVTNDNAIICDLRDASGVGILITATKVSLKSADGVVIETEYKSDENVRVGFVINKVSGTTNQRLSFIYANGIVSRGDNWAIADSYYSDANLLFTATNEAEISLKSIRIYDIALTSDQMLNNYTLYRDTIAEMMEVYDRNDIYADGTTTFSPDKMMGRLPVMIVTGDIPTLENTSDKDTQIVVDIDYYNMQDTTKSFKMTGAAMRPQGTSSMGYPKKNFRIYTQKVDGTIVYDSEGKVVEDKLYSFKEGAQPVNCWCLKADYAESSGTHNTGIARLWNEALKNAQVDGEYVCRTGAQKAALAAGYEYDVRTTIDGFPILLFYRPSANDDVIFIGKYNFNNDKSTESVFGFENIPDFDNSKMQCWEVLNNGNPLALFTTVAGFDEGWSEAFESRYPDTKTPNTDALKAFCTWMTSVSKADFATQKWEHLNVYMMAAYWCYLMRHAAADQFVKNAMFTTEDGKHFYYILYDNDTINGLINTGDLEIKPTDDRETVDESGAYVFAGHDSRLWNMLQDDEEFIDIVSAVDNALYSAGISYANTIRIFDDEQADKWVERVYNQDAQYKYVSPYVEKGIDNLFMLQGKRDLHRRWWLAKRFSIYDAKYVSGTYKSQAVELKCINGTLAGQQFTIRAGYPLDYGYGINNVPRDFGITLDVGDYYTFTTEEVVNLGDPIRIYGSINIAELDLSLMSKQLAVVTVTNVNDSVLGTKLTKLIVGNPNHTNTTVEEISGLKQATALEYLDVQGMSKILSLDLSNHIYIKTIKAYGSGISSITFSKGAPVERLELPATMRTLTLGQLPYLTINNLALEDISNIALINIQGCPNLTNSFDFVYDWWSNKNSADAQSTLVMDNVLWSGVTGQQMAQIANIANNGGTVSLKGKIVLTDITEEQGNAITQALGDTVFTEGSELYIDAPITVTIKGADEVLEGYSANYVAKVYPLTEGTIVYSLPTSRQGCTINANTGVLITTENGLATSNIIVRATFTSTKGEVIVADKTVSVVKRVYPTNVTIVGNENPIVDNTYSWTTTTVGVTGEMYAEWSVAGAATDYIAITEPDLEYCTIEMTFAPVGVISGSLSLTIKKTYNDEVVATATIPLAVYMEGVILSSRTNAPIQTSLYNAELVANETYTLKSEAEAITGAQLQPGTAVTTSIFYAQRNNITSFDEFRYFTGVTNILQRTFQDCKVMTTISLPNTVTELANYVFQGCSALETIGLSTSLKKLGSSTFANCVALQEVVLPDGFTTTGSNTFINCPSLTRIYFPSSTNVIGGNVFMDCGQLMIEVSEDNPWFCSIDGVLFNKAQTKLIEYAKDKLQQVYEVPSGVTNVGNYAFYNRKQMTSITFPSTLTRLGNDVVSMCPNLSSLTFNCVNAPSTDNASVFGATNNAYTGRNTYSSGTNRLRIPFNATGYETGLFLDPLQNASKCGFSIHGKLILSSNKSDAQFSIQYTTEAGVSKTVTVGVGTCYLSDIKYGTSLTATPKALGDNVFDSASTTITYNGATTITNNAYIYPKNATIVGEQNPTKNPTYTWTTTTVNVNGEYTATWALNGDVTSYISIASQDNESCTLSIIEAPTEEITGTLTLSIKPKVGNTVTTTKTLKALLPGVVITSKSNAPVQAALYAAGAVANETYSLKSELERITDCSTMFKRKGILTFDEFQYFTGVRTLPEDAFSGNTNLSRITIPKNVSTIATLFLGNTSSSDKAYISVDSANTSFASVDGVLFNKAKTTLIKFALGKTISNYTIPSSVTTIGEEAFYGCDVQTISCANALRIGNIWGCNKLTKLNFDIAAITGINGITRCTALQEISFADGFTTKATNMINGCKAISKITSKSVIAPTLPRGTFNDVGKNNTSGTNRLILPINATGYESGTWAQLVTSNGFYIHGKLVITSNKSDAQFDVKYTTEANTSKTVTVGVGTFYLNDIKYGTSLTATPKASGSLVFDSTSTTITYNGATTITNNAYVYPSSVTINGVTSLQGGNSSTFTAAIAPSNVEVDITYNWSISGSSNATIASTSGNQCTINTATPEEEENFTLTCVVKSTNGKVTVQDTHSIELMQRPNFVTATYNVTNTSAATQLLFSSYKLTDVTYMDIDGVEVTPTLSYTFSTSGNHTVRFTLNNISSAFRKLPNLTILDFSECNGSKYSNLNYFCYDNTALTKIIFGDCVFPAKTGSYTFSRNPKLEEIQHNAIVFPVLGSLNHTFNECSSLKTFDFSLFGDVSQMDGDFAGTFYNCSSLSSIEWAGKNFTNVSDIRRMFYGCSSLTSIDLSPFASCQITDMIETFYGCVALKTIIAPWSTAPTSPMSPFGTTTSSYTGRNTYNTGKNMLIVPAGATGYDEGYWGSVLLKSAKCGFTIARGVFIQHINGILYTNNEWTSSGYSNEQANGVAVLSDECSFVIAKSQTSSTLIWGGYGITISDIITSNLSNSAILDYDGLNNTKKIIAQLGAGNAPSAEACTAYTFPNGKKGYLPSLGEGKILANNISAIRSAILLIGGSMNTNSYLMSSTQYDANSIWVTSLYDGKVSSITKTTLYRETRAFTTLF